MASKETLTLSPLEYYYLTCLLNAEDTNDFYEIDKDKILEYGRSYMHLQKKIAEKLYNIAESRIKSGIKDLCGYEIQVDLSANSIINTIVSMLSSISNNNDKLLYNNISTRTLDYIKQNHPIAKKSDVVFYRDIVNEESFIITTEGVSYYYHQKCEELTWIELKELIFDDNSNTFHFYSINSVTPVISIHTYDLIKWSSDNYAVEIAINAIIDAFKAQTSSSDDGVCRKAIDLIEKYFEGADIDSEELVNTLKNAESHLNNVQIANRENVINKCNSVLKHLTGKHREARKLYLSLMDTRDANELARIQKAYKKFMAESTEFWKSYTDQVAYKDRMLIMPVSNIKGCAVEEITAFTLSELPNSIQFPVGHPVLNELYIGHPYSKDIYVPYSEHEFLFLKDKIDELSYLLQCLGAEEIRITSVKGSSINEAASSNSSTNASADIKAFSANISASSNAESTKSNNSDTEIEQIQRFDPYKKPYIPDGLTWYPFESQWQRLAKQRMDGNMLEYHLTLSSKETSLISEKGQSRIEASAKYIWAQCNFEHNESTSLHRDQSQETTWKVDVIFRSISDL